MPMYVPSLSKDFIIIIIIIIIMAISNTPFVDYEPLGGADKKRIRCSTICPWG